MRVKKGCCMFHCLSSCHLQNSSLPEFFVLSELKRWRVKIPKALVRGPAGSTFLVLRRPDAHSGPKSQISSSNTSPYKCVLFFFLFFQKHTTIPCSHALLILAVCLPMMCSALCCHTLLGLFSFTWPRFQTASCSTGGKKKNNNSNKKLFLSSEICSEQVPNRNFLIVKPF